MQQSSPPDLTNSDIAYVAPAASGHRDAGRYPWSAWTVAQDEPDWVKLSPPGGGPGLSFQTEVAYVKPTWPAGPGDQQMMVHLDIAVDNLDAAGAPAVAAGAVLTEYQPQDDVRVYLDPAGHPFCLWVRD